MFLEANACGKPVVGTRSDGVPDAIVDGETGFVVDEEDAEGAAAAMLRVLVDPVLAAHLGEGARKWAGEHSWPGYADRHWRCIEAPLRAIAPDPACRSLHGDAGIVPERWPTGPIAYRAEVARLEGGQIQRVDPRKNRWIEY